MKKAIVIGASSGIGKGLAKILVSNNYRVGITGRRLNLLEELKIENPENYIVRSFDIADNINAIQKIEELAKELGGIDLLILSAGWGDISEQLDTVIEKHTIDTNVVGFTIICDWIFSYFQKQNNGHLVAISSIAGLRGNWQSPAYSASKAFQIIYLEGLRHKAKKLNLSITITDIRPGFVDTEMAKSEIKFWIASVDKAVKQIYGAIKNKRKVVYITKRWFIIALLARIVPRIVLDRF